MNLQVLRLLDAMCLANGLTDAFALEARPSSATYNPISAAAWNAAKEASKANKGMSVEAMAEMSDAARSEAEAKMLGASAMNITPGTCEVLFRRSGPSCYPPPPPCSSSSSLFAGPLYAWYYCTPGWHISAPRASRALLPGTFLYLRPSGFCPREETAAAWLLALSTSPKKGRSKKQGKGQNRFLV